MVETVAHRNLSSGYTPATGVFDELQDAAGLRPQWEAFARAHDTLGAVAWARRWEGARRMLREHGVTYNVHRDNRDLDRPWELDSIPLILSADEWRGMETGLAQRARLLNAIVADIYGPQRLLRDGVLPAALVFANPNFWRALHDVRVPHNLYLHLYAADLGRSPDGRWWVMADRAQTASGIGYALENRTVLARNLPEVFRSCGVQRITGFFEAERRLFASLASRLTDNPRLVVLTGGPRTQTYFEHAYLARQLGFPLVEGSDLTVRDDCVFLKTLEGLQRIDVIRRRIDDALCDPLELLGDSWSGAIGLVQAARAGNVAVANALGTGIVEVPALMAFLPNVCRHLLGEELAFASVATWWCGQPDALRYVLEHLPEMVIKPSFSARSAEPIFVSELPAAQVEALTARLCARPGDFVAQETVNLSCAPTAVENKLEARSVMLRTFAIADVAGNYTLMPGGLTRVMAGAVGGGGGLMHQAEGTKDTWVLGDSRTAESELPVMVEPVAVQRAATDLPSRVADDLFWMGRYAERAEATVRLVRAVLERLGTESQTLTPASLQSFVQILDSLGLMTMDFGYRRAGGMARALESELLSILSKQQRPGSLRDTLNRMHRIGRQVRDRLSTDTWRILNQLHQAVARPDAGKRHSSEVPALLSNLITGLAAFSGMEMENMTRGYGWRFLDLGRRLERTIQLDSLLTAVLPEINGDEDRPVLEVLLDLADSSMTYRSRYFTAPALGPVIDLIVADETNPRSIAFQISALRGHVRRLPRDPRAPTPTREEQLVDSLKDKFDSDAIQQYCREHLAGNPAALNGFLREIFDVLLALSDALTHYYFSHAERPRAMTGNPS